MFLRIEYIIGKSFFVHNLHIGTKTRLHGFFVKYVIGIMSFSYFFHRRDYKL